MFASQTRFISQKMALNLLERLRSTSNERLRSNSSSGLTLIECLVAIIIVSLTVLAITPPILLATGTRVQSRRAEQANHIAQSEVDRLRLLVERGPMQQRIYPIRPLAGVLAPISEQQGQRRASLPCCLLHQPVIRILEPLLLPGTAWFKSI